jgi:NAD+ diphosphatase
MSFIAAYRSSSVVNDEALVYLVKKGAIAVTTVDGTVRIPSASDCELTKDMSGTLQFIGQLSQASCYTTGLEDSFPLPAGFEMLPLRKLSGILADDQFQGALYAAHIVHWTQTTKFCGGCGQPTQLSTKERAKECAACGLICYPRLSPAVITAVIKDDRILLGHSNRFQQKLYSVIAGFVEPGETLEACVAREVKEETGIAIEDIRYFSSQPWPFPDSLMIGFTARYASGEIQVDGDEITDAAWFAADELPTIPDKISIARRLIDWFVEKHKKGA